MSNLEILLVPALAGVLVLLSHVPLGRQVLGRGIVFIDLAIAQVAALGVLVAGSLAGDAHGMEGAAHGMEGMAIAGLAGACAALAGAALVAWLGQRWPERREALIGLVYVAGAVLALLWVSADHSGGQRLAAMLSGDVLWVSLPQLLPLALATAGFLILQWRRPGALASGRVFYPAFAILISLSVPLLGLYLVFASLIVPALAVGDGGRLGGAVLFGALAYALGLLASLWLDLPSGPCVVLALVLLGVGSALWRRL